METTRRPAAVWYNRSPTPPAGGQRYQKNGFISTKMSEVRNNKRVGGIFNKRVKRAFEEMNQIIINDNDALNDTKL